MGKTIIWNVLSLKIFLFLKLVLPWGGGRGDADILYKTNPDCSLCGTRISVYINGQCHFLQICQPDFRCRQYSKKYRTGLVPQTNTSDIHYFLLRRINLRNTIVPIQGHHMPPPPPLQQFFFVSLQYCFYLTSVLFLSHFSTVFVSLQYCFCYVF